MALYYQNFYILVVFVPFLHTSRTFVLPVHAVQDSAQVLEERVEHELGSRATHLPPNEEPGLSSPAPHIPAPPNLTSQCQVGARKTLPPPRPGWDVPKLLFFLTSRQAHIEVYEYFLKKRFHSKIVFPSAFSKAY